LKKAIEEEKKSRRGKGQPASAGDAAVGYWPTGHVGDLPTAV
jgi:hypothetical protein